MRADRLTDKQTNKQTDILITILRTLLMIMNAAQNMLPSSLWAQRTVQRESYAGRRMPRAYGYVTEISFPFCRFLSIPCLLYDDFVLDDRMEH